MWGLASEFGHLDAGAAGFVGLRSSAVNSAGRSVRSAMSAKAIITAVKTPTCAVGTNGENTSIRKPATSTTVVVNKARPLVSKA